MAMDFYLEGNWTEALEKFEEVKKILPNDGPAKALVYYI